MRGDHFTCALPWLRPPPSLALWTSTWNCYGLLHCPSPARLRLSAATAAAAAAAPACPLQWGTHPTNGLSSVSIALLVEVFSRPNPSFARASPFFLMKSPDLKRLSAFSKETMIYKNLAITYLGWDSEDAYTHGMGIPILPLVLKPLWCWVALVPNCFWEWAGPHELLRGGGGERLENWYKKVKAIKCVVCGQCHLGFEDFSYSWTESSNNYWRYTNSMHGCNFF